MNLTGGRSTSDLVILWFAIVVGVVIMLGGLAVVALQITRPDVDTSTMLEAITENLTLILGAVIGYLAGRTHSAVADGGRV